MNQYQLNRENIQNGDLILFRDVANPMAWLIRKVTGSRYSHVGMAVWLYGRLFVCESLGNGTVLNQLRWRVENLSGKATGIDVYRVPGMSKHQRKEMTIAAIAQVNKGYDYVGLVRYVWHLWRGTVAVSKETFVFCSEMCDRAKRAAMGADCGFKRASPDATSPGDIADGSDYQFTIL